MSQPAALSPAAIALNRFGLGSRPDEAAPADPRRWLFDQFARFDVRPAGFASLDDAGAAVKHYREEQQANRRVGSRPRWRRRRLCHRPHRQRQGGEEPADGRPDLGHQRRAARGDRDRSAGVALLQRRSGRISDPVNADIVDVQTTMLPETDTEVNELGIKGLGELGNVGLNAAVANAVFHATGVRVRELPIRIEKLLGAPALTA